MGGISIWQLLIIALIVILLFGSKKLRGLGSDLGDAVKGFKKAVNEEPKDADFPQEKLSSEADSAQTTAQPSKNVQSDNAERKQD